MLFLIHIPPPWLLLLLLFRLLNLLSSSKYSPVGTFYFIHQFCCHTNSKLMGSFLGGETNSPKVFFNKNMISSCTKSNAFCLNITSERLK